MKDLALAVDLGATKILAALVRLDGTIVARRRLATPQTGPRAAAEMVTACLRELAQTTGAEPARIGGVGLAAAGLCNPFTGVIAQSPNLAGWDDVPFGPWVQEGLGMPVWLGNDANAAALGELHFGAGRGLSDFIYVTVSSGIGAGLIIGGKLYLGHSFSAGEVGHLVVEPAGPPCGCGSQGCLEALASGLALAAAAARRLRHGEPSLLNEMSGGDPSMVTAELIHQAARAGDGLARDLVRQAGDYLGIAFTDLVNLLNPQAVIVGGGLSKMGDLLLEPARAALRQRAYQLPARECAITVSGLGDDVGILGAAALVRERLSG